VHAHLRNCQRRELACTLSKPPLGTPRTGKACDLSNTVTSSAGTRISRSAFAGLDQGTTTAPNETQSRKPVNTPDQRKPQYHRKEGEDDSDGGITWQVQVHECAAHRAARDTLLLPRG